MAQGKGNWGQTKRPAGVGMAASAPSYGLQQILDDLAALRVTVMLQWPNGGCRGRLLRRVDTDLRFRPESGIAPDPGTTVRATYETPDGTMGFSTQLLAAPAAGWRLAMPTQLADLASRGERRVHVPGSAGVTAELADGAGDVVEVGVLDLSHGGLALRFSPQELPPGIGERLSCRVLQRGNRIATVKVEIVHVSCLPGEPLKVGCRFIHARHDVQREMDRLAERCAMELSGG